MTTWTIYFDDGRFALCHVFLTGKELKQVSNDTVEIDGVTVTFGGYIDKIHNSCE